MYITELLWNTILPAIKISILLFYRRLFPLRRLLVASSIIGAIVVAWYIAIQITAIFQCLPIHYFWLRVGRGHCIRTTNFYIALASLNLATDVAVLILPIPFIWQIQIRKSKKLSLSAVFLVGLMYYAFQCSKKQFSKDLTKYVRSVCVTSVIRLQTLTDIDSEDITCQYHSSLTSPSIPNTPCTPTNRLLPNAGSNVYPGLWTIIEASLGIVAACLPSLGPILQKMTGHLLSTTNNTTGQSQHNFAHAKLPFRDADMGDLERILDSGPQGRDEAVILNAIVGRSSADFVMQGAGTSHEMEALREDGSTARKEDAIVVRKDIEQDVEQRIE